MTPETFFANFGHLADAPNGVQKLREMILQLAVQGKLVPQDTSDEPASVLLERMAQTKDVLAAKGVAKIKKYPKLEARECVFRLPTQWQWARWGDICDWITYGFTRPMPHVKCGIPIVTAKNIVNGPITFDNTEKTTEEAYNSLSPKDRPVAGDILLTKDGSIGRVAVVPEYGDFCINQSVAVLWLRSCQISREFLVYVILSPLMQEPIWEKAKGAAIKHISITDFGRMALPIPPHEEQKRIVAKVDQLMALCDQLEARQQKQQQGRMRLNSASLDALLAAREPEEFATHWQRISTNFDLLYNHPETIPKLRAAILQLAVQGKLVPQDPNDEPASVLLERIKAEKERLDQAGRGKSQKDLPKISNDEGKNTLPPKWELTRLGSLVSLKSGTTVDKKLELPEGDFPYVKVGDMNLRDNSYEITTSSRFVNRTPAIERALIPPNSIIFPKRGGAIATNKKRVVFSEILVDLNTMAMTCPKAIEFKYLFYWFAQFDLWSLNNGTSVPQVNNKDIEPLLFPLPPLKEQKRIVAKVDQLMALCDELEAKLNQAKDHSKKLMEATVRKLVGVKATVSAPRPSKAAARNFQDEEESDDLFIQDEAPAIPHAAKPQAPRAERSTTTIRNIPQAILDAMQPGREYSRAEILDSTGIAPPDWTWAIKQLKEQNQVTQTGDKRGARYRR